MSPRSEAAATRGSQPGGWRGAPEGIAMADESALRRVGLTFGAITALIALIATTMVLQTSPDTLRAQALASVLE